MTMEERRTIAELLAVDVDKLDTRDRNDWLIEMAANGRMEPLLARLRQGVQMSGATSDPFGGEDTEVPSDPLMLQISTAVMRRELTERQFKVLYAAAVPG